MNTSAPPTIAPAVQLPVTNLVIMMVSVVAIVLHVNVNGGAVGLGHPLAATGTRLVLTLAHELKRSGGRYGIATACIGGGQGIAVIIESI